MQYKKVKISAAFILSIGLNGLFAQEAILTTGGNALGSGGSASYSVGQVFYSIYTGTNGTETQGVQQPYEIMVVTSIENANNLKMATISKTDPSSSLATSFKDYKSINLQCIAYPNPTSDILTLTIEYFAKGNLSYRLFDIYGKLLEYKKVENNNTVISMGNLVPGTYFLNVVQCNKEIKTFKIIKTEAK